jgi:hypothetical protein
MSAEVSWPAREVVQLGITLSTLGAGLQSLVGAPRLIAAIANDRILPFLEFFTTQEGEEPRRALLLTVTITLAGVLVGPHPHPSPDPDTRPRPRWEVGWQHSAASAGNRSPRDAIPAEGAAHEKQSLGVRWAQTAARGGGYSNAKVANRDLRDFEWEIAHAAVTRRPLFSLHTVVPRTGGYSYAVGVWDMSIVQGPFSVAPCHDSQLVHRCTRRVWRDQPPPHLSPPPLRTSTQLNSLLRSLTLNSRRAVWEPVNERVCGHAGNLDLITPIITMFFLLCYAGVNLSCILLSLINAPSWRPRWQHYHWVLSSMGLLLCLCIMFLISWIFSIVALGLALLSYLYVSEHGQVENWGDGIKSLRLQFALKTLRGMDHHVHPKNWCAIPHPPILLRLGAKPNP